MEPSHGGTCWQTSTRAKISPADGATILKVQTAKDAGDDFPIEVERLWVLIHQSTELEMSPWILQL